MDEKKEQIIGGEKKTNSVGLLILKIIIVILPFVCIGGIIYCSFLIRESGWNAIVCVPIIIALSIILLIYTVIACIGIRRTKSYDQFVDEGKSSEVTQTGIISQNNQLVCSNCNTINPKDSEFCSVCGLYLKISYVIKDQNNN